jgi:DNA-binding IclR family transcriptional regulator
MAEHTIPDDLRRFILTSIPSVPYLEAILLLQREAAAAWNAPQLARRLYLPEAQATQLLHTLEAAGVAEKDPAVPDAWRYLPAPDLAVMLERLERHYSADLFAVTTLIHSSLDKRAYQFADAFRWRKDS